MLDAVPEHIDLGLDDGRSRGLRPLPHAEVGLQVVQHAGRSWEGLGKHLQSGHEGGQVS